MFDMMFVFQRLRTQLVFLYVFGQQGIDVVVGKRVSLCGVGLLSASLYIMQR